MTKTCKFISDSEAKTKSIAKNIASEFNAGDIILLDGDLGAGKTHFVKGFSEYFNYESEVTSPTFNIVYFYETTNIRLIHIDLYRLESIQEFNDLGIEEYFEESIVLIEWGKKIVDYLDEYFSIKIDAIKNGENSRNLTFSFRGEAYRSKFDSITNILAKL